MLMFVVLLLWVLEEGEIFSLGGSHVLKVDFALPAPENDGFIAITSSHDSGFEINVFLQTFVFAFNKLIKTMNTLNVSL